MNPQVVLLKKDKHGNKLVLLIKRRDTNVWTLPGGKCESNESLQDAAIREVSEETGYNIQLTSQVGKYDLPHLKIIGSIFLFTGEVINGNPKPNKEVSDIKWFNPMKLPYTLLPFQRERIKDAISGRTNLNVKQPHKIYNLIIHYLFFPHILIKLFRFYIQRNYLIKY